MAITKTTQKGRMMELDNKEDSLLTDDDGGG